MLQEYFLKPSRKSLQPHCYQAQTYNELFHPKCQQNRKNKPCNTKVYQPFKIQSFTSKEDSIFSSQDEDYNHQTLKDIYQCSIFEGRQKYEIQSHLRRQNQNLKQQINFLGKQVRKAYKKVDNYNQIIKEYKRTITKLEYENDMIRLQYLKINQNTKDFIQKLRECPELIMKFNESIRDLGSYFNVQNPNNQQNLNKSQVKKKEIKKMKPLQNKNVKNIKPPKNNSSMPANFPAAMKSKSDSQSQNVFEDQKLQGLNDQFQALMYQLRKNKQSDVRKKCIQIVKEIKNHKKDEQINIRKSVGKNIQNSSQQINLLDYCAKQSSICLDSTKNENIIQFSPERRSRFKSYK